MASIDRSVSGKVTVKNEGNIHVSGEIETRLPADVVQANKDRQNKEDGRDRNTLLINSLTLLAVAGATLFSGFQYRSAERQAKAAEDQLTQSKEQAAFAERPWISYAAEKASPLYFDENGANLVMKFRLHNSGQTPATRVHTFVAFVREMGSSDLQAGQEAKICAEGKAQISSSDVTLFPNTDAVQIRKFRLSPEEIIEYSTNGTLPVQIVSCVAYQSTLDNKPIYDTGGQTYALGHRPTSASPLNTPIRAGVDVPVDDLVISVMGENAALTYGGGEYHSHDPYVITSRGTKSHLSYLSLGNK